MSMGGKKGLMKPSRESRGGKIDDEKQRLHYSKRRRLDWERMIQIWLSVITMRGVVRHERSVIILPVLLLAAHSRCSYDVENAKAMIVLVAIRRTPYVYALKSCSYMVENAKSMVVLVAIPCIP